jgi:uncharacterized Tic20 family protein
LVNGGISSWFVIIIRYKHLSQVLIGIGSFVILINLHRISLVGLLLLLIGCIVDEHREERLSILSDHLDLAKSYLGMKKMKKT